MREHQAPSGEAAIGQRSVFIIYIAPISFYMVILLGNTITNVIMLMEWCQQLVLR